MALKTKLVCLVAAGAVFAAIPAGALVQTLGSNRAQQCFVAAKAVVNLEESIGICNAALREDILSMGDRARTLVNRGVLENAQGHPDQALADYEAGIKLDPNFGDAYGDRGAVLIGFKRYDEALADINKGIALGLSYPHIGYYNRALAEESTGRFEDAYYDLKHALELEPDFTLASEQLKNFTVINKPDPA